MTNCHNQRYPQTYSNWGLRKGNNLIPIQVTRVNIITFRALPENKKFERNMKTQVKIKEKKNNVCNFL